MRSVLVAAVLLLGSSDVPTVGRGLAWVRANPMFCGAHDVMVQSQRHLDAPVAPKGLRRVGTGSEVIP